jgi:hypothetical protein
MKLKEVAMQVGKSQESRRQINGPNLVKELLKMIWN